MTNATDNNNVFTTGNKAIDWVIGKADETSTIPGVIDRHFSGNLPARMVQELRDFVRVNKNGHGNLHFEDGLVSIRFYFSPYKGNNKVRMSYTDCRELAKTCERIDPDA